MQKTNFSRIIDYSNELLIGFISSSWRSKSINLVSVLIGYFLKFISEGKNELIMVPIIIVIAEIIVRIRPSQKSNIFNLWSVIDKLRIGSTYAIILEAFKLGS